MADISRDDLDPGASMADSEWLELCCCCRNFIKWTLPIFRVSKLNWKNRKIIGKKMNASYCHLLGQSKVCVHLSIKYFLFKNIPTTILHVSFYMILSVLALFTNIVILLCDFRIVTTINSPYSQTRRCLYLLRLNYYL